MSRVDETPWKPATTGVTPSARAARSRSPRTSRMRALVWSVSVMMPAWLPVNEAAGTLRSARAMHNRAIEIRSPAVSSMSSSRPGRSAETCSARWSRSSVVLPMALTTTTTSSPERRDLSTCSATARIRSASATEVPPNFCTTRLTPPSYLRHERPLWEGSGRPWPPEPRDLPRRRALGPMGHPAAAPPPVPERGSGTLSGRAHGEASQAARGALPEAGEARAAAAPPQADAAWPQLPRPSCADRPRGLPRLGRQPEEAARGDEEHHDHDDAADREAPGRRHDREVGLPEPERLLLPHSSLPEDAAADVHQPGEDLHRDLLHLRGRRQGGP